MDNLLIQVIGDKDVLLYPPSDLPYLYLQGNTCTYILLLCTVQSHHLSAMTVEKSCWFLMKPDVFAKPAPIAMEEIILIYVFAKMA